VAERSGKRQATIAQLKREIVGFKPGDGAEQQAGAQQKPRTALEEHRAGYVTRGANKVSERPAGRAQKRKNAEAAVGSLKSFQERLKAVVATAEEEAQEAPSTQQAAAAPEKEQGTFAAIWDEGDEEGDRDWLAGAGLKFHVSADKAFRMEFLKGREQLAIFDPLAAKGNSEALAEERKRRSEQMRPTLRRKEPPKKW